MHICVQFTVQNSHTSELWESSDKPRVWLFGMYTYVQFTVQNSHTFLFLTIYSCDYFVRQIESLADFLRMTAWINTLPSTTIPHTATPGQTRGRVRLFATLQHTATHFKNLKHLDRHAAKHDYSPHRLVGRIWRLVQHGAASRQFSKVSSFQNVLYKMTIGPTFENF